MSVKSKLDKFNFFYEIKSCLELCSKKIIEIYEKDNKEVFYKKDESPITKADLASHEIICDCLMSISSLPIISEESDNFYTQNKTYWLVDPLDGTKEFINKNGEFTINIALINNKYPDIGYVYLPVNQTLYAGGLDKGSIKCFNSTIKEISTSTYQDPVRVVASRNHLNNETKNFISNLKNYKLYQAGSSIKFCMIAEGQADIYPRLAPTSEWDTAAAQAIVEGAGGSVKDMDDKRLAYQKDNILNPFFVVRGKE